MSAGSVWRRVLVLGGARSGKSAFAERLAASLSESVIYVATGGAWDSEMAERIRRHREQRPPGWQTVERARGLAEGVLPDLGPTSAVLIEDATLLLSSLVYGLDWDAEPRPDTGPFEEGAIAELAACFALPAHVIVVSNEVGMGLVPPYPLGRAFRDALGRVNQAAAARASEVYLIVAGLPLTIKSPLG